MVQVLLVLEPVVEAVRVEPPAREGVAEQIHAPVAQVVGSEEARPAQAEV